MMGFSLSTCILDHLLADVYTHQRHLWIGLSCLDNPATRAAADIEHTMEDSRISLLGQDTSHHCCDQTIMDRQTGEFFLVILRGICTPTIFILPWAKGGRHGTLLLLFCCSSNSSCPPSNTAS